MEIVIAIAILGGLGLVFGLPRPRFSMWNPTPGWIS